MNKRTMGRFQGTEVLVAPVTIVMLMLGTYNWGEWCEERERNKPILVQVYEVYRKITAPPRIAKWWPLRGIDDDKDGTIDKFEQLWHGAPRIPFGAWHEIKKDSPLAQQVQKEYDLWRNK